MCLGKNQKKKNWFFPNTYLDYTSVCGGSEVTSFICEHKPCYSSLIWLFKSRCFSLSGFSAVDNVQKPVFHYPVFELFYLQLIVFAVVVDTSIRSVTCSA